MAFWIDTDCDSRLAIVPRPRGGDWLLDDIRALKRDGIDILVSLLTPEESRELALTEEAAACTAEGIRFLNYPICDRETPESSGDFLAFAHELRSESREGFSIGVHCRACIGRSSVLLATLLRLEGLNAEDAFNRITKARGIQVPDTDEQELWVKDLAL